MPDYVVTRVSEKLNAIRRSVNGSTVLVLGLAYKKNSGDARESPAIAAAQRLVQRGANVRAADPLIDVRLVPTGVTFVEATPEELEAADLVLVLTDHDAFDWSAVEAVEAKVLDTRNRLRGTAAEIL
jgi:UDP-N-acetyl-D-mannosaminuronic acid dehydrogenase/UDP-N-acetyl-D-glucosamine dehydrogenase